MNSLPAESRMEEPLEITQDMAAGTGDTQPLRNMLAAARSALREAEQTKQDALKYGAHCEERAEQAEQREADLRRECAAECERLIAWAERSYSQGRGMLDKVDGWVHGDDGPVYSFLALAQRLKQLHARLTSNPTAERIPTPLEDLHVREFGPDVASEPAEPGTLTHDQIAERWLREQGTK